jgi:hypothetical protein
MKKAQIVLLMSVTLGLNANAQKVLIQKRDSSLIETKVNAHSEVTVITNAGNIPMKDIASATFIERKLEDQKLYTYLNKAGAQIKFGYQPKPEETVTLKPGETDKYVNFHVANNAASWIKHYSKPGAAIKDGIMSNAYLRNMQVGESKLYAEMVDFIPKQGSDIFGGKAIIVPDSTGYSVTLKGISMKMGTNRTATMAIFTGVQMNGAVQSFDNIFIKNGKFKLSGRKSMDELDIYFTRLFDFP